MQQYIDFIKQKALDYHIHADIAKALSAGLDIPYTDAYVIVTNMIDQGILVQVGAQHKLALASTLGYKTGRLVGNARGFAFCKLDEEHPDVFIPHCNLKSALHRDIVLIKVKQKGDQFEGEVVKVLQRSNQNIVGRVEIVKPHLAFVKPDDAHFWCDILVRNAHKMRANDGDKVVCRIRTYATGDKNPQGDIVEVLGHDDTPALAMLSIIRNNNLYEEFEPEVLAEAATMPTQVNPKDKLGRVDFTDQDILTIDSEDTRDIDDAIGITKNPDGTYTLGVHIADVSHYVRPDSKLDQEAFKRGTSVYFPDLVYPMLPKELSNGICSLNPKVDRLTLSVIMTVDTNGDVIDYKICEGVIRSREQMTYKNVYAILQDDPEVCAKYKDLVPQFKIMEELHYILLEKRKRRGALEFDLPECKFVMDEMGHVLDVKLFERNTAHMIIESFMLLANETVAEAMCMREIPFLYRVHEQPDAQKMFEFFTFIQDLKLKINSTPEKVKPKDLQLLLKQIEGEKYASLVNQVMLRSLQKARYASKNLGHFGIAATYYCHFTSPIRRYPDLAIHRIIKSIVLREPTSSWRAFLDGWVDEACVLSSEREKLAEIASREVDDLKKTEYMQQHLMEEFDGIITGATSFGVFVALPNTIEGLCPMDKLPEDNYLLFEKQYKLAGSRHSYQLGDSVRVRVIECNLMKRQITFEMVKKL